MAKTVDLGYVKGPTGDTGPVGPTGPQGDPATVPTVDLENFQGYVGFNEVGSSTATGNEFAPLSQIKNMFNSIKASIAEKLSKTEADAAYAAKSHTHTATQVTGLTASRALVSDGSGHPTVSAVTSTELGYLNGVTSAIQAQLNGKAATGHTHAVATTSAAGFMSAADKTKLNGLNNYTLPAATSTTLGGVKIAIDTDFETYLGI